MGFAEILTIIFICLKVLGVITWSWWLVLLPEMIAVVLYIAIWLAAVISIRNERKAIMKLFRDDSDM